MEELIKEKWNEIKESVRKEYNLSEISYHTWVEPLEFYNIENDTVNIIIPSDQSHALNYISSKYKSFFQVTITEMFDHNYDISFILEKDVKKDNPKIEENFSSNPSFHINYENANLNAIPLIKSISRVGWIDESSFFPYVKCGDIVFESERKEAMRIAESMVPKGDFNTWVENAKILRKNLY